ncbi:MAG: class I SAM-dependent methyltransferase [Pseudonocardia sp.]
MSSQWTEDPQTWPAPADRRRIHWTTERELRELILASSPAQREQATSDAYGRLFAEVPWHRANVRANGDEAIYEEKWFRTYGPLTRPGDTLADLGGGRGGLVHRFCAAVREGIGIDACEAMTSIAAKGAPANARFVTGSAVRPPLAAGSVDVAVSRQVLEHLHPDDVPDHLVDVRRILRSGGRFLIETPSRLTGPWDVSRGFTPIATGFHLHEYTNAELARLLRAAGFRRIRGPALPGRLMNRLGARANRLAYVPAAVKVVAERVVAALPIRVRRAVAGALVVREVMLVAEKR